MDLKFYLSLFVRRLPWFLLMLFFGSAVGLTLATVLPPVYVARSTLIVESEQIPSDLAETTVTTATIEALQIIQQRILTRERLIEMANRLGIYATRNGTPQPQPQMSADDIVKDLRERIAIKSEATGGSSRTQPQAAIVRVSFEAATGQLAANVVNELVTALLRENVAIRTSTAGQTLEFFQGEVDRLGQELDRIGADILSFQERNLNALPDSLDFRRSQQAAAQERMTQLDRDEATLRDRRERLVTLYRETGEVAPVADTVMTAEERQLRGLQDELDAALAVLAPQNPRVQMMQSQIAALQNRMDKSARATEGEGKRLDPRLTSYEMQLADIDGQLEFITEQKGQIRATMDDLQQTIAATPANAIMLEGMQRDYDAIKTQYNQAVANRARAATGDTLEALSKGQRISVVDPAVPPAGPDSPNRPLIAAAGIGLGLMMGFAVVVLLEVMNTAIRRPEDLKAKLGITPFATLAYIRTRSQARRRKMLMLGAYAVVLIGLPALLWWINTNVTPLDLLLDRALDRLKSTIA